MSFTGTSNQFMIFLWFLLLGLKCGMEQKVFNWAGTLLTNKLAKVLKVILNVIFIAFNCAQFYFLALKMNFGGIRPFMFFAFFLGFLIPFAVFALFLRLKNIKKQKIGQKAEQIFNDKAQNS